MTIQTTPPVNPRQAQPAASALATFVACVQLMLDPAIPEDVRRQAETRALAQLPVLRALGLFDLFDVRDPALAALLRDELAQLEVAAHPASNDGGRPCAQRA